MKNKEIEESINRIKSIVDFYKLNDENNYDYSDDVLISMKNLLSYIEQLENNRNKALKIIDSYDLGKYDYSIPAGGIIELREALRGGSDD